MTQCQDNGTGETYEQETGMSREDPQRYFLFPDQGSINAEQGGGIKLQYG